MNKYIIRVTDNQAHKFSIVCGQTVISSHKTRREALDTISAYYHGDAIYGNTQADRIDNS